MLLVVWTIIPSIGVHLLVNSDLSPTRSLHLPLATPQYLVAQLEAHRFLQLPNHLDVLVVELKEIR